MILNRLYELAVREKLLADSAFEDQPVPFVIVIGKSGKFLGVEEHRNEVRRPAKKKGMPNKVVQDRGIVRSIPRPHGNTASQGFARYFVDTLPRVLPIVTEEKNREKELRSRKTFWAQIDAAADATGDAALRAVQAFGRELAGNATLADVRDGWLEVVVGTRLLNETGSVYLIDHLGQVRPGYPKRLLGIPAGCATLAELNDDGLPLWMFFSSSYASL